MTDHTSNLRLAAHRLDDEADFSLSWTDGRRGDDKVFDATYIARRLEVAAERSSWAESIRWALANLPPPRDGN